VPDWISQKLAIDAEDSFLMTVLFAVRNVKWQNISGSNQPWKVKRHSFVKGIKEHSLKKNVSIVTRRNLLISTKLIIRLNRDTCVCNVKNLIWILKSSVKTKIALLKLYLKPFSWKKKSTIVTTPAISVAAALHMKRNFGTLMTNLNKRRIFQKLTKYV
jgi:hypothetical protein